MSCATSSVSASTAFSAPSRICSGSAASLASSESRPSTVTVSFGLATADPLLEDPDPLVDPGLGLRIPGAGASAAEPLQLRPHLVNGHRAPPRWPAISRTASGTPAGWGRSYGDGSGNSARSSVQAGAVRHPSSALEAHQ